MGRKSRRDRGFFASVWRRVQRQKLLIVTWTAIVLYELSQWRGCVPETTETYVSARTVAASRACAIDSKEHGTWRSFTDCDRAKRVVEQGWLWLNLKCTASRNPFVGYAEMLSATVFPQHADTYQFIVAAGALILLVWTALALLRPSSDERYRRELRSMRREERKDKDRYEQIMLSAFAARHKPAREKAQFAIEN